MCVCMFVCFTAAIMRRMFVLTGQSAALSQYLQESARARYFLTVSRYCQRSVLHPSSYTHHVYIYVGMCVARMCPGKHNSFQKSAAMRMPTKGQNFCRAL